MKIGTRSVLFGAHQFLIHPWFVAWGWWRLFGFPWDPRLWFLFFFHDVGYLGKPNMDGPEGEEHPVLGARLAALLDGHWPLRPKFMVALGYEQVLPTWETRRGTVVMGRWALLSLLHSRFFAKSLRLPVSQLCYADKMAICLTPFWLYLPMTRATGELREYMIRSEEKEGAKYKAMVNYTTDERQWFENMRLYLRRWVEANKDGKGTAWTSIVEEQP
jgi:hypothetical protein